MNADPGQRLAELRDRFAQRAARERGEIREAIDSGRWDDVRRLAHGLSGIAGTFGYAAVGDAASLLEESIDDGEEVAVRTRRWSALDKQLAEVDAGSRLQL